MRRPLANARLESHLGYWLRLVSNQVSGRFARILQAQQLSVAEWVCLSQIDGGTNLSSAELAEAMGVTRGAVSKILDKLQARDWISRTASPADLRIQFLSVTRLGRRMLPDLTQLADGNDAHFFSPLSAAEQATLGKLLKKIAVAHQINIAPVD